MIVEKKCKHCKGRSAERTTKRNNIKYICQSCGKVSESKYPRKMVDKEKARYLKRLEMII